MAEVSHSLGHQVQKLGHYEKFPEISEKTEISCRKSEKTLKMHNFS